MGEQHHVLCTPYRWVQAFVTEVQKQMRIYPRLQGGV